ncbi:MAG: hypothetical protein LBB54_05045 [Cellulomonadaceae bacterium]|jgi:hypothetical protein|nr:hypothetical protein [Cellulomonadaceae bacterium]
MRKRFAVHVAPAKICAAFTIAALTGALTIVGVSAHYALTNTTTVNLLTTGTGGAAPVEHNGNSYVAWEQDHARLSKEELERRQAASEEATRKLAVFREYERWEATHARLAEEALEARILARKKADAAVQAAQQAIEQQGGTGGNLDTLEQNLASAEQAAEAADKTLEDAKQRALNDAKNRQRAEQESIEARYANQSSSQAAAMNIAEFASKKMVTTVDVNIRRGPGTEYEIVRVVPRGSEIEVNGNGNGFYRLTDGTFIAEKYCADRSGASGMSPIAPPTQEESSKYAWQTYVANVDSQAAIDACQGGVTYSPDISRALGKDYYPIHVHCQGEPILSLKIGDRVHIQGVGDFVVVDARDVQKHDDIRALDGMRGVAVLQTCYRTGNKMRAVSIDKV